MSDTVVNETVVVEGMQLEIIAEQIGSDGWQLAVRNPFGIFSIWNEWFSTSEAAMDAARKAIEAEGLEGFFETEGFEYLLN
jgi:hypothetical protein